MFSRSLATPPSRSPSMKRRTTSSPETTPSPVSPPLHGDQEPASFDVTLLMPHRYGGISELHSNDPNFQQHYTSVAAADRPTAEALLQEAAGSYDAYDTEHGSGAAVYNQYTALARDVIQGNESFAGNTLQHINNYNHGNGNNVIDNDEDYAFLNDANIGNINERDSHGNSNNFRGVKAENDHGNDGGGGGIMDFLNIHLSNRRSTSRLSTVIQVRPYEQLPDEPGEQSTSDNDRSPTGSAVSDSKHRERASGNNVHDIDSDNRSVYSIRVKPVVAVAATAAEAGAKVSRSKSFNYGILTASSQSQIPGGPKASLPSLSNSYPKAGFSRLSQSPTTKKQQQFVPRKLSSGGFYGTQAHSHGDARNRSRVTL